MNSKTSTTQRLRTENKRLREALDNIAGYPLPTFTVDGRGSMVPLDNAAYLRQMAREALAAARHAPEEG